MSGSNRFGNRLFLLLAGLALVAAGAAALVLGVQTPLRDQANDIAGGVLQTLSGWSDEVAAAVGIQPAAVPAIAVGVVLLVIVVVALVVVTTRGGGRSREVLVDRGDQQLAGEVTVAASAAESLFLGGVADRADVVSATTSTHLVRGRRAVKIRVQPRQGAAIADIVSAVGTTVRRADALLGQQIPVVLELAEGARARLASDMRTASTAAVGSGHSDRSARPETVAVARDAGDGPLGPEVTSGAGPHHNNEGGTT